MSDDGRDLSDTDRDALLRWRLSLGPAAENVSPDFGLGHLGGGAGGGGRRVSPRSPLHVGRNVV